MTRARLESAFGYRGDAMNLPVTDVDAAVPFYEDVLGFRVVSRSHTPRKSAVLARDSVTIRLAENGGNPSQDGCAFHVNDVESLLTEFNERGLGKEPGKMDTERDADVEWKVFYVSRRMVCC